ncbi:Eco57I restriction-modification methylase domain-containing protein, partial [bacterium]|nr:Eco57I restriction-modification methylase domain-containing protein [bacterium]
KNQIDKLITQITNGRRDFDFEVYFSEVFHEKGGFDIVIGNPPYIQLQKRFDNHRKYADLCKDQNFETFDRTGDIYCLFYERGNQLLKDDRHLIFITSNKWMRTKYGEKLRKYLAENTTPKFLIDLGPGVFESATVDTCILLFQKGKRNEKCIACDVKDNLAKLSISLKDYIEENKIELKNFTSNAWIILSPIEQRIKEKIEKIGIPLKNWDIKINRGILTGFNEAFIIDGKTKDELIKKDPKSAEIIKPILRGKDIKRYYAKFADKWLIASHNGYIKENGEIVEAVDIENYPAIKEWLDRYWKKISKRQDKGRTPYNLRDCAYWQEFEKEKIVYGQFRKGSYAFIKQHCFLGSNEYLITSDTVNLKYLISVLNSKLSYYYLSMIANNLGRSTSIAQKSIFVKLPVPEISELQQKPFIKLVNQILEITSQPNYNPNNPSAKQKKLETEIDKLVYKLYDLSEKERKIVEKK